ncbi:hypothetical protein SDC9_92260 [bioreactor metagenome]|uniref:Uncharacterized protein n=1 Tax=bioreactor metagenome TaxID=1076179 RepID=A0A644ZXM7_9ZZZZ
MLRGLEAGDAIERRRNAHRAAGVGANRDFRQSARHGHARAARRSAGNARHVVRVAGCAVVRIDTDARERELGHVGLADDHRTRRAQALHDDGIGSCGRRIAQHG